MDIDGLYQSRMAGIAAMTRDDGHGHQDRQPAEGHCPPDVPAAQAVPARILAQREEDAQRHETEEHQPLDPLVAQAPRVERTEAGQHVVVAVQHQERAGEEQERRGQRRHPQPQEVELDPIAGAGLRRPADRRRRARPGGRGGHGGTGYQPGGTGRSAVPARRTDGRRFDGRARVDCVRRWCMTLDPTAPGPPARLGISLDEAARHVEHLGFLDVNGTTPQAAGGANLVVALRDRPTLTHFDPERVEHWVVADGRGRPAEITRATEAPLERPFSWGTIRVVDRLEVLQLVPHLRGDRARRRPGPGHDARRPVLACADPPLHGPQPGRGPLDRRGGGVLRPDDDPDRLHARRGGPHRGGVADGDLRRLPCVDPGSASASPTSSASRTRTSPPGAGASDSAWPTVFGADWEAGRALALELGLATP